MCQGQGDIIWIILILVYIALTQLVAVFLAFLTRKVEIKAMNDAKSIAVIIYLTTVIVTIMIICAIVLRDYLNADGATFGGLLLLFTTITLSLLFIPKVIFQDCNVYQVTCTFLCVNTHTNKQMVILYRDPKGKRIFRSEYLASNPISQSAVTNVASEDLLVDRTNELEKYSQELEQRLQKYEVSMYTKLKSLNTH